MALLALIEIELSRVQSAQKPRADNITARRPPAEDCQIQPLEQGEIVGFGSWDIPMETRTTDSRALRSIARPILAANKMAETERTIAYTESHSRVFG